MTPAGRRVKRTRLVHTDRYVVAVEVELVVPPDDPTEPCYEPATLDFLKEVRSRAAANDIDWLKGHGKVYEALAAV